MSALRILAVICLAAGAATTGGLTAAAGAAAAAGTAGAAGPAEAPASGAPESGPSASVVPAPGPTAVAEADVVSVGQRIRVHGDGWGSDTSQVVSVVLCGNAALDGAADCDLSDTAEGGIRDGGTFYTLFTVPAPALPCPCLLRVFSPASAVDVKIPVSVVGAPTQPPQQRVFARRAVRVDAVHLQGRGPWASWFGAAPRRVLVYRVTNTGEVTLHDPPVDIVWGKGPDPSGFVPVPAVGDLPVGATRTFRVPIRFPALSFGSYRAVVKIDPFGEVGTGESATNLTPWGLIVGVAAGPCLPLALRVRARRCARGLKPSPLGRAPRPGRAPVPAPVSAPAAASVPQPVPVSVPVAGWYADPLAEADLRLWDGTAWTDATKTAGAEPGGPTEPRPVSAPLALVLEDSP